MSCGKIIFLDGVSSSGKSSLAKELQKRLTEPFLHLQLDDFIHMLPTTDDMPQFMKMVDGMHRSIAAMSDAGNNLIVDHVLVDKSWTDQCVQLFADRNVLFVGLRCLLEELERREKERGPRRQGFARAQIDLIDQGKIYDLMLDTQDLGVEECAERVLEFYGTERPTAFGRMRAAVSF